KARLAKHSDSWELTAHEAANVAVQINGVRKLFPATIDYDALSDSTFSVSGSGGLATVLLTGLPSPTTFEIVERLGAKNYPLGERISVEAGPQYHYDINTQTWTAVLALELTDKTEERVFMLHIKNQ
ncbi:MAG TPA: hypothetical protein DCX06_01925, partial [Opitutae bacterium]|nr:hypothetical protein [Opitutae bacterium]